MANKLEEARERISQVDAQMAKLFVQRMKAVEAVCEYKMEFGLPILDAKREEELIAKNSALVEDEVLKGYYVDYLKQVMGISRSYQHRMQQGLRVAYSGVEGAFAHLAAGKIFPGANPVGYADFKAAYDAVLRGESDVAVLPIENSYAGDVGQSMDLIFSGELFINGVYELEVHQNLLGLPEASLEDIRRVTSHPQALSQCQEYLQRRGLISQEAVNTAVAAKEVAEAGDKSVAAIASLETAAIYGLKVLEPNINQRRDNTTRFAVLSRLRSDSPALTNSVLLFSVKHEAGSLAKALAIMGEHGFNLTALRSRPLKKQSWQYYFYVEVEGNLHSEQGRRMLEALLRVCDRLKVAGGFAPHTEI